MLAALVALHVLIMFSAVAISQGPAFMLHASMRRGDVAAIRGVSGQFAPLGRFIGPTFGVGVLVGLAAVFVGEFDPFAPWLLIAYALTVLAIATPRLVTVPRMMRVGQAAAASPLEEPSADLRAAITAATTPIYWLDAAILALFIIDMVVKPFS